MISVESRLLNAFSTFGLVLLLVFALSIAALPQTAAAQSAEQEVKTGAEKAATETVEAGKEAEAATVKDAKVAEGETRKAAGAVESEGVVIGKDAASEAKQVETDLENEDAKMKTRAFKLQDPNSPINITGAAGQNKKVDSDAVQ